MPTLQEIGNSRRTQDALVKTETPVSTVLSIVMPVFNEEATIVSGRLKGTSMGA
jgi:hypothetical protein